MQRMQKKLIRYGILLLLVLVGTLYEGWRETSPPAFEGMEKTTVQRVVDGDTFVTAGGERVRMIGIDTPETVHPSGIVEAYGVEASDYTKALIEKETVYMEKDVSDRDQYDRLLRYVYLEDGTFVNLHLVEEGYATVVTYPPDTRYTERLLAAEQEARDGEKGLWGPQEKGE
jgi:micrococcal nuclease